MSAPSTTPDLTTFGYDAAGRPASRTTTRGGPSIAACAWTRNGAGNVRGETSTISGDPANGATAFAYDQPGRITTYTPPAGLSNQAYGWASVPDRTSLAIGANPPVVTTFDAANRPVSDTSPGSYASDLDGRITTIPAQGGLGIRTLAYDSLGRLSSVAVAGVTRYYSYDPLDRLRLVSSGGVTVEGFRYVGATGAIAQSVDGSGTPIRSFGTDWTGTHLLDWTGAGANVRFYGVNGHGDLTWTADATGAVSATLHYDPYGTLVASSGTSLPEFRFQGSWSDTTAGLSWAVARWYAPSMGTFLTEDSLLGTPAEPSSRQLYAYGAGDPVDRADTGGTFWYLIRGGDTLAAIAQRFMRNSNLSATIYNLNRLNSAVRSEDLIIAGGCIYVPYFVATNGQRRVAPNSCPKGRIYQKALDTSTWLYRAASGFGISALNLRRRDLEALTRKYLFGRGVEADASYLNGYRYSEVAIELLDMFRVCKPASGCSRYPSLIPLPSVVERDPESKILVVRNHPWLPLDGINAETFGRYVYMAPGVFLTPSLKAHEYIHILEQQGGGADYDSEYVTRVLRGQGTALSNRYERIAYLWQGWIENYPMERLPWAIWKPVSAPIVWWVQ